jgi:hypothetical protein
MVTGGITIKKNPQNLSKYRKQFSMPCLNTIIYVKKKHFLASLDSLKHLKGWGFN